MESGKTYFFDQLVIATHSDQALKILEDPCEEEKKILEAIPYQVNEVILHTDTQLLPENPKVWSSWNYRLKSNRDKATVTYNMNILQGISAPETFCVTLNDSSSINTNKILGKFEYQHPVFSFDACSAQKHWASINGVSNTWYCGAYWGMVSMKMELIVLLKLSKHLHKCFI